MDEGGQYFYRPFDLTAAPGEPIALRAVGQEPHTFTPVQEGAWPDTQVAPGGTASVQAPGAPGEYRFFCRFHASEGAPPGEGMAGVLRVREGAPAGDARAPGPAAAGLLALAAAALLARRAGQGPF